VGRCRAEKRRLRGRKRTPRCVWGSLMCNAKTGSNLTLLINGRLARPEHTPSLSLWGDHEYDARHRPMGAGCHSAPQLAHHHVGCQPTRTGNGGRHQRRVAMQRDDAGDRRRHGGRCRLGRAPLASASNRSSARVARQGFACAASQASVALASIASKLPSVVISVIAWPNLSASAVQGDFLEKATNISAVTSA
jgi:hypothetical protein